MINQTSSGGYRKLRELFFFSVSAKKFDSLTFKIRYKNDYGCYFQGKMK